MQEFDVVIIGSGPGGYVCAIRCAQLGMKVAIVEKYSTLGGTCLNVGCIPSKAWLDSSERYHQVVKTNQIHGIEVETNSVKLNFEKMSERVQKVIKQTCDGVKFLMNKNKITVFQGVGSFVNTHEVKVGETTIHGKNIVIATGSKPGSLPGIVIDKKRIISSTEALKIPGGRPESMVVIGGGVIGCEMGSVFARLGTKVTLIEYMDQILPTMDSDCAKELVKALKKEEMEILTSMQVKVVENLGKKVKITFVEKSNPSALKTIESDYCLMAVGRIPYTTGLGLEKADLQVDERGRVPVNEHLQTKISHIYAIGDVVRGAMLAHKAEDEGMYVAEFMAGQKPHINYNLIPGVVYTWPEVAWLGASESELKQKNIPFKKGSFPMKALGRARTSEENFGMIKILAHATTDEILGVHMTCPRAADLIMEAVVAMEYRASAEDIARMSHPHPTYSEAFREAALAATENRSLHI
ncbi:MAG: dihydrolipoyl dehydrogenase [Bacteriovoracaceae bacterium]|nr:dihydrolipoyl dehydrogenase [Bacteriovoracaceae bacterium]